MHPDEVSAKFCLTGFFIPQTMSLSSFAQCDMHPMATEVANFTEKAIRLERPGAIVKSLPPTTHETTDE